MDMKLSRPESYPQLVLRRSNLSQGILRCFTDEQHKPTVEQTPRKEYLSLQKNNSGVGWCENTSEWWLQSHLLGCVWMKQCRGKREWCPTRRAIPVGPFVTHSTAEKKEVCPCFLLEQNKAQPVIAELTQKSNHVPKHVSFNSLVFGSLWLWHSLLPLEWCISLPNILFHLQTSSISRQDSPQMLTSLWRTPTL